MTLRLQYKQTSSVPVEVEGITPNNLREKSLAEIEQTLIYRGNEQVPLAELFSVSGDASDECFEWTGELSGVHWIGANMTSGVMQIDGHAGRHVGSQLQGGEIHVSGDAGDWVGGEMRRGFIRVRGRAGHLVGSAYRGSPRGMTGGTILVDGDVGNELGHSMRRGLIAVGGNTGDLAAFNMLAGTILIFGSSGIRHAAGMKRGTLAFLGQEHPPLLPTFRHACRFRPDAMALLLGELRRHDFNVPADVFSATFDLYNGDLIEGGRGEILLRAGAA